MKTINIGESKNYEKFLNLKVIKMHTRNYNSYKYVLTVNYLDNTEMATNFFMMYFYFV